MISTLLGELTAKAVKSIKKYSVEAVRQTASLSKQAVQDFKDGYQEVQQKNANHDPQ